MAMKGLKNDTPAVGSLHLEISARFQANLSSLGSGWRQGRWGGGGGYHLKSGVARQHVPSTGCKAIGCGE